jgi:hypothetical protein
LVTPIGGKDQNWWTAEASADRSALKEKTASVPLSAALEHPSAAANSSISLIRFLRFINCAISSSFRLSIADGGITGRIEGGAFWSRGRSKSCGAAETF